MSQVKDSRTSKSITNAKVALFFMLATFAINFISRRYFLDGLGPELMGMRTTVGSILSMLSLSELGIGTSISVSLYKPLNDRDYTSVTEIVSLQGWLYRWVFGIITLAMGIIMVFIPQIFDNMQHTPLIYVYLTLGIFYLSTILSYTVNYKSVVLGADQKWYKVNSLLSTATLIKTVIQIFILKYVKTTPYLYWLAVDLCVTLISVWLQDYITKKEYHWLTPQTSRGKELLKKYPNILQLTGRLFLYNIAAFITSTMTPFIIFSVVGLVKVAYYDNYKNLVTNIRAVVYSIFTNMSNGIGALVAEGNQDKSYQFFWEMISLKYLVSGIVAFGLLNYSSPVINLWLGEEYILDFAPILIMSLIAYIDICSGTVGSYINNGYKLYQDIWAPITEGIIFLVVAIICGKLYGFTGALLGSLVSQIIIIVLWKPYNLFHNGFQRSVWDYWKGLIKLPILAWTLITLFTIGIKHLNLDLGSWFRLILHAIWITSIFALLLGSLYYVVSAGFRRMMSRLYRIAHNTCPQILKQYLPPPDN